VSHSKPTNLLRIPFIVKNGVFLLATDMQELPGFVEGATGEILIIPLFVSDVSRLKWMEAEQEVDFLPERTKLLARVNDKKVPGNLRRLLHREPERIGNYALVEIILLQKQQLRIRPGKEGNLTDCACVIPALKDLNEDQEADSINHVCKRITEHFEPHRRSYGGNVFDKVYHYEADHCVWRLLREHRENIQKG